jgi:hypothetical protein
MIGIVRNIIDFYQIQAEALNVLVTNTQKVLEQSGKERKADKQMQRLENFIKDLAMNLNNMLTKFHFFKERKDRRQEQLTKGQTKAITEFAIFVKALTRNVSSLLKRFKAGETFEKKIDKEIKELEASVVRKLKEFDKALDESKATLVTRLIQKTRSFVLAVASRRKSAKTSKKPAKDQNIEENFSARSPNTNDDKLENLFDDLNIKSVENDERKSEYLTHLKV